MRVRVAIISIVIISCLFFSMMEIDQRTSGQISLQNDTPTAYDPWEPDEFETEVLPGNYMVVGVRPEPGIDNNIAVYTDTSYSTLIDSSNTVGDAVDFVVLDKDTWTSPPNRGVKVTSGSNNYVIEMENEIASHNIFDTWNGFMNKSSGNPVLDIGPPGSWDDVLVTGPSVIFDGTMYHMWYDGGDGSGRRIGYANSTNGINWTKPNLGLINYGGNTNNNIVLQGSPGTWDEDNTIQPTVVFDGIQYHMWYVGIQSPNIRIGYAMSLDGLSWIKNPGPVFSKDVGGTWDDVYVHTPMVLYNGSAFHMWYQGDDGSNARIGYATSLDGISWTRSPYNPVIDLGPPGSWDDFHLGSSAVIFKNGLYHMWYSGSDGTNYREGYAISPDGNNWTKSKINPILDLGLAGSWDEDHVGISTVINVGSILQKWYGGYQGSTVRIGYAAGDANLPDLALWTKNNANPVLDTGPSLSWDDLKVSHPTVIYKDDLYHMWYAGLDGSTFRIGYANSTDGINWVKYGSNPVVNPGPSAWESAGVQTPSVLFDGTIYHMWYSGWSGGVYQIGYANSSDGINWNKYSTPVLTPDTPWDSMHVYSPTVLLNGGIFHMWYSGYDGSLWRIGYATSFDGINWVKSPSNPVLDMGQPGSWDDERIYCPDVIFDNGLYHMWYSGYDGAYWRNGYASSLDGIIWTRSPSNPILDLGTPGSWDDEHISHPAVISGDITYHMWYSGNSTDSRIGYATYNINFTKFESYSEVLDAYEISNLTGGKSHTINLAVPGTLDLDLFIFKTTGGRNDAVASSTNIGFGVNESITFITPSSGDYLLVITNEENREGQYGVSVIYNPPIIVETNAVPDPQEVYGEVNISANITDNLMVYGAWVEIFDPIGGFVGNYSMFYDPFSLRYFFDQNYDILGLYTYTVWANDTQNYWESSSGSFYIHDTIPPLITDETIIPDPQEVFFMQNISANITDNYQLFGTWVEIHDPLGGLVGNFSLSYDSSNLRFFWNQSFSILGNYAYTIWANDSSNNWASSSGLFSVHDTTPPAFADITSFPDPQEVFFSVNVSLNISDNYQLYGGWLEVFDPDGSFLGNFSLSYDPISGKYYWIQDSNFIGDYTFVIHANDTSNNWANTPGSFEIVDTAPPSIVDIISIPDPQEVFFSVNVSANITDNYELYDAWIEIFDPMMNYVGNYTMYQDPITGRFYFERPYDSLDGYTFNIWANDTSNNWNMIYNSFIIQDTTPPIISNVNADPDPQEVYNSVRISATIVDNYQVNQVWVRIEDPQGNLIGNQSMNYDSADLKYYLDRDYDLLGTYSFTVYASDTKNNWVSESGTFTIQDTTPPDISNVTIISDPQEIFDTNRIEASVSDNYELSHVWLEIYYPNGTLLENVLMENNGLNDIYYINNDYDIIGTFTFTIWANDSSNNLASHPGSFIVHDATPPLITNSYAKPVPQEVFGEVEIDAWVTDNYQLDEVWVEIYDPAQVFLGNHSMEFNQTMSHFYQVSIYKVLGNYTFNIWAKDSSDNWATDYGTFKIVDTTPPIISNIIISNAPGDIRYINVSAIVTDNYRLDHVWIEVIDPDGSSQGIFGMDYDPIQGRYYLNREYDNPGEYSFTIIANDTSDNQASSSDSFTIEAPPEISEDSDEYNWKPIVAIIFALVMLILGIVVVYFRPIKFTGDLSKDRTYTFLMGVSPFVVIEIITGIISYLTGLLSIPPIIGIGLVVDLSILIVGLICIAIIYGKGTLKELYEEEILESKTSSESSEETQEPNLDDTKSPNGSEALEGSSKELEDKEVSTLPSEAQDLPPPPPPPP